MKYLGDDIKKLGFGMMRLPKKDGVIDIEQTKEMVDHFMEAGFTYFDTAYVYDDSEDATRRALVERYPRESYQLATKNAAWLDCKSREDAIAQFEGSLKNTGAGYFDYYLLHNLGDARTAYFDKFGLWDWLIDKKKEGLVKHIGFSFHDSPQKLEELLMKHPQMEFVQLQINYADWENPAIQGKANYEIARKYGKSVIIMEPVKGGSLANPPEEVSKILKQAEPESSIASWALRYAADKEGVITVLSGMSSVEQMKDNISYMNTFTHLNENQKETIVKAQKALERIPLIPCTNCNYCAKVCPMNIGISSTFSGYNIYRVFNNYKSAKHEIDFNVTGFGKQTADKCIKCGACVKICPQHIAIPEELEKLSNVF